MDREYSAEWFRFADMDLDSAEFPLDKRPPPHEEICYRAQQSAGKFLKGYLISKGVSEPPRTRDLPNLCDMCREFDDSFIAIGRACDILARYGVHPRYPGGIGVAAEETRMAIERAREIRGFECLAKARGEASS